MLNEKQPPWFLPETPEPSGDLVVVKGLDETDYLSNLAVRSLQGLVNRDKPKVWIQRQDPVDGEDGWLGRFEEMGLVKSYTEIDPLGFLDSYKDYAEGIVVPPFLECEFAQHGYDGHHVAVMTSAAEDLIVAGKEMAQRLDLPVVVDYTDAFRDLGESLEFAYEKYLTSGRLNTGAVFFENDSNFSGLFTTDYVVQHALYQFTWHTKARVLPGSMARTEDLDQTETETIHRVLELLPGLTPVLGSPGAGEGYVDEGRLVITASRYGKIFVPCAGADNLSVHAGYPKVEARYMKQNRPKRPDFNASKAYIAVHMSDGDNTNLARSHWIKIRNQRKGGAWHKRGKIPLGWSLGPAVFDLIPGIARYYLTMEEYKPTVQDEWIIGFSGLAYIFPGEFGENLDEEERERLWDRFMAKTKEFMDYMDTRIVTIQPHTVTSTSGIVGEDVFTRYAKGLPSLRGIFNGYNSVAARYRSLTSCVDGIPIFHSAVAVNRGTPGDGILARGIQKMAGRERPAFIHLFVIPMGSDLEYIADELSRLPEDFLVVQPSAMAELYHDYVG